MDILLKCISLTLIGILLYPVLSQKDKTFAMLLILGICCMVLVTAVELLEPILAFWNRLEDGSGMDQSVMNALIKIVAIGMIAEIASLICNDSGNASLGKAVGVLASVLVLILSLPLMQSLLDLITEIMELI